MTTKANPAANLNGEPVLIPGGSYFYNGAPFNRTQGGIVYTSDGKIFSVANPECVPDVGYDGPVYRPFAGHLIPGNRAAELRIVKEIGDESSSIGHGFEWELPVIDAETGEVKEVTTTGPNGETKFRGKLGQLSSNYVNVTPEAHRYVAELGIAPANTVDELSYNMIMGTSDAVTAIVADGGLPLATDVVGHRKMGTTEASPDKYLTSTIRWMASQGHFNEEFRLNTKFWCLL